MRMGNRMFHFCKIFIHKYNSWLFTFSAPQTPRPFVSRISEDIFHRSLTRTRSQLITASTPHKELLETHFEVSSSKLSSSISSFAQREKISRTNSKNQESCSTNSYSPESPLTTSSGPMTRSRSASKVSQSDSHPQLTKTPDSSTRYYLRARSSTKTESNANLSSSQSRNSSNIRQRTYKDSNSTPKYKYQTRSRTGSNKTKVKATDRCCTKLAVVVRRVRMSMIARLRCRRSSIWLPTPQKKLQPQRLATSKTKFEPRSPPTPKKKLLPRRLAVPKTREEPQRLRNPTKRLQPRRLPLRKTKISARRTSSRHASCVPKRWMAAPRPTQSSSVIRNGTRVHCF